VTVSVEKAECSQCALYLKGYRHGLGYSSCLVRQPVVLVGIRTGSKSLAVTHKPLK